MKASISSQIKQHFPELRTIGRKLVLIGWKWTQWDTDRITAELTDSKGIIEYMSKKSVTIQLDNWTKTML